MSGAEREVHVVGADMVPFGKYPDKTLAELAWPAVRGALRDADLSPAAIQAAYCGTAMGGMLAGQRVLKALGISAIQVVNVENACSSSASALREAWLAVTHGVFDTVLVIGVEKLTKFGGGTLPLEPEDFEVAYGMTMPALYAMRARRYMHEFGLTKEDLAAVAVKAKAHGALNPYAQFRKPVTLEDVLESRMVADPLTLFQCCPTGDGAAALVVTSKPSGTHRSVRIVASELTSGRFTTGFRDMTTPEISVRSAQEAYRLAGLGPDDVDVAEIHDAFTIAELMYYEALQFCKRGEAAAFVTSGASSLGGQVAVNPSGGLLSKGHPVGATGAAQAVEVVWQLRGDCGPRQAEGARVGLTHATGGGISGLDHGACAIHIYTR